LIFAVHMPVWGRWPLLRVVLSHLSQVREQLKPRGHTLHLSVAGSEGAALRKIVCPYGDYVEIPNAPLGAKVNAAFLNCKKFRPDALVGLGSDDLVSPALFVRWGKLIAAGAHYLGALDLYQYSLRDGSLTHWPGYECRRRGEVVGPGRCMTRSLADALRWQPFPPLWDRRLDMGLEARIRRLRRAPVRRAVQDPSIRICDVETGEGLSRARHGRAIADPQAWLLESFGRQTTEALQELASKQRKERTT
jgi:hypothetical protein